jgi:hypothetical protein
MRASDGCLFDIVMPPIDGQLSDGYGGRESVSVLNPIATGMKPCFTPVTIIYTLSCKKKYTGLELPIIMGKEPLLRKSNMIHGD